MLNRMRNLLFLAALFATTANAQSLTFQIKPIVYKTTMQSNLATTTKSVDTCDKITLVVSGIGDDSARVNYFMLKSNGASFTGGTVNVPLSFVSVALVRPINISNLNAIFSSWNIEAIRQITEE